MVGGERKVIGDKIYSGDVIFEVEDTRLPNLAPEIVAGGAIKMTDLPEVFLGSGYTKQNYTDGFNRPQSVNRVTSGWSLESEYNGRIASGTTINKLVTYRLDSTVFGVPGTLYSGVATVDLGAMLSPGYYGDKFHLNGMPQLRLVLYATNGTVSQDVELASAEVLPAYSGGTGGYTSWDLAFDGGYGLLKTVGLNAHTAMPSGKTQFRLTLEYASNWNLPMKILGNPGVTYDYTDWAHTTPIYIEPAASISGTVYSVPEATSEYVVPNTSTSIDAYPTFPIYENWDVRKPNFKFSAQSPPILASVAKDSTNQCQTYGARARMFVLRTTGTTTEQAEILVKGPNNTTYTSGLKTLVKGVPQWITVDVPASSFSGSNNLVVTANIPSSGSTRVSDIVLRSKKATEDYEYGYGYRYTDLTQYVTEATTFKSESQTGIATIVLRNDGLDTSSAIVPGKKVRIRTNTLANTYDVDYTTYKELPKSVIFTGTVLHKKVRYGYKSRPEIVVTVVDTSADLQKNFDYVFTALSDYVQGLPPLGINVVCNGVDYGAGIFNPSTFDQWKLIDESGDATVKDCLMITRNSTRGYVWVDKHGRVVLANSLPETVTRVFKDTGLTTGEFSYSQPDVAYDTTATVNYIDWEVFDWQTIIDDNGVADPQVVKEELSSSRSESIQAWGQSGIKLQVYAGANLETIANSIFNKYDTPVIAATGFTFPVRNITELGYVTQMNIYDMIQFKYKTKIDVNRRILSIEHKFRPGKPWVTKIDFGLKRDSALW
ncbi:hypothetical protein C8E05_1518 [Rhodococcus wratislaviensis]|uniref:Uncharacterized protein n=1 Tax=Rhodococcus wratislaviensis TaxID=44752 RepID=A0AB38F9Y9_RHOWR|nr:hypothetical protein [Rhodococcus wratislaviensis]REE72130.1 hypothetical protein C8E05_1518 [Rhodococcus wratislaviensis]SPZ38379.1 Uncharacterised protein [Rhodococcus wratislaviensis]